MNNLINTDKTPIDFSINENFGLIECLKRPIRKYFYPLLNAISSIYLKNKYKRLNFKADLFLYGQRGNDYIRQRNRVNNIKKLNNASVLIAGCGTGKDVFSWINMSPKQIVAVDLFNYKKAWDFWINHYIKLGYKKTNVKFCQGELNNLSFISDKSIDVIGSDAVFEHIKDLNSILIEFHRILKSGGILYATFGPLWFSWGGDHVSGYDSINSGYNHLILDNYNYNKYLDGLGDFNHSEDDGRTWIKNKLFSYLKPQQYLDFLESNGFTKVFTSVIIDKRAEYCLNNNDELSSKLLSNFDEIDLLISGMTIVYKNN